MQVFRILQGEMFKIPFLEDTTLFLFFVIFFYTLIGLGSKYLSVASYAGFLIFIILAVETGHDLLMQLLYATLVISMVGMGLKFWDIFFSSGGEI